MKSHSSALRDFTVDNRTWLLIAVALVIGAGAAGLAVLLLRAIALATNIFYYHRVSLRACRTGRIHRIARPHARRPRHRRPHRRRHRTLWIGKDSRPRHSRSHRSHPVAWRARRSQSRQILKPILGCDCSSAFRVVTFGFEGPIIATGGDVRVAHPRSDCKPSDAERTTLLVAAAAAGMSAVFASPLACDPARRGAAALRMASAPASLVPVAVASVLAGALRIVWLGPGPIFPVELPAFNLTGPLLIAAPLGAFVGLASAGLSRPHVWLLFEDSLRAHLRPSSHSSPLVARHRRRRHRCGRLLLPARSRRRL